MSKKQIEECVRASLEGYFKDLRGTEPDGMYDMLVKVVEKPLLEVVMAKADHNQSGRRMAGPEPQHAAQEAASNTNC
jgi:Fis family transcriptional regulator